MKLPRNLTFTDFGKTYRIVGVFVGPNAVDEANAFMEANPKTGVIESDDDAVWVADCETWEPYTGFGSKYGAKNSGLAGKLWVRRSTAPVYLDRYVIGDAVPASLYEYLETI